MAKFVTVLFVTCTIHWVHGALTPASSARGVIPGACPVRPVMPSFDYSRFEGVWYLMQSEVPHNSGMTCIKGNFSSNGQSKSRESTYVAANKNGERFLVRAPEVVSQEPQNPAKLQLRSLQLTESYTIVLAGIEVTMGPDTPLPDIAVDHWIVDTDYTNYAITWTCGKVPIPDMDINAVNAAVWTRLPDGVSMDPARLAEILRTVNIDPQLVSIRHPQNNCDGASPGSPPPKPSSENNGAAGKSLSLVFIIVSVALFPSRVVD